MANPVSMAKLQIMSGVLSLVSHILVEDNKVNILNITTVLDTKDMDKCGNTIINTDPMDIGSQSDVFRTLHKHMNASIKFMGQEGKVVPNVKVDETSIMMGSRIL